MRALPILGDTCADTDYECDCDCKCADDDLYSTLSCKWPECGCACEPECRGCALRAEGAYA